MRLTRLGKNILAKAIAESFELHFTRFAIGDGNFDYETERVYDLTDLKNWRMDLPLTELKVIGNGTAEITANLSNAEVTKACCCREHGLFVTSPEGEEVLFSYRNLGDEYDFIPAFTNGVVKNIFLTETIEIQDCENITAVIDYSVAYLSTTDFQKHLDDPRPHLNAPCHYDDVQTATEIWATDNDSHLHKISVENLRDLVKTDEIKNSEQDIISAAQNELGLAANILLIEDFLSDEVTDYFKSKVTSYAEHGNLLGIENPAKLRTGGTYILSDGVFVEEVQISAVQKNLSGYYAKLTAPVANTYNTANLYLYRTTPAPCDKGEIVFNGCDFAGTKANISQNLEVDTDYLQIEGDGFFDGEFLTLR